MYYGSLNSILDCPINWVQFVNWCDQHACYDASGSLKIESRLFCYGCCE